MTERAPLLLLPGLLDTETLAKDPGPVRSNVNQGLRFARKSPISGALSITYGNHCPSLEAAGLSDLTEKLQPRHTARGT